MVLLFFSLAMLSIFAACVYIIIAADEWKGGGPTCQA